MSDSIEAGQLSLPLVWPARKWHESAWRLTRGELSSFFEWLNSITGGGLDPDSIAKGLYYSEWLGIGESHSWDSPVSARRNTVQLRICIRKCDLEAFTVTVGAEMKLTLLSELPMCLGQGVPPFSRAKAA